MILRPYQTAAVQSVFTYFESGNPGHPIIVMPTATGKSVVIAELIRRVLSDYPDSRVIMLTHVRELISQNLDKLKRVWPDAPVGAYSAGLRQKSTDKPILFCGIQSVWNRAKAIASESRPIELVFIDECHRVPLSENGTYRRFIADLTAMNPHMRVIGLTATPYRYVAGTKTMTGGYQSLIAGEDRIFTDICYDLSASLVQLINEDYLAALWPTPTDYRVNLSGVKVENGDYKNDQLNQLMEKSEVIDAILDRAIPLAQADSRRHWMVFCTGVAAAEATAENLRNRGISAATVTGDTPAKERDRITRDSQNGQITALVSVNTLTTGYDSPVTDCLIVARPTLSPVLYVQIMGRGMRVTPEKIALEGERKRGCLVLDFVGNVDRHGPIDRLVLKPPRPKEKEPTKVCPECNATIRIFATTCPECGHEFPPGEPAPLEVPDVSKSAIIAGISPLAPPVRYPVSDVRYSRHVGKSSGVPTLRADYYSGMLRVASEWICLSHDDGYARSKAIKWWQARQPRDFAIPGTVDQAMSWIQSGAVELRQPSHISVRPAGGGAKYDQIVRYEWAADVEVGMARKVRREAMV